MAKFNLKYFGLPALGEPPRLLFALGKIPFEDQTITFEEWGPIKPTTKWGQVPVLTTPEGKEMTQSKAISRYLAKLVVVDGQKLYPDDPLLAFDVDEMIDAFEDVRMKIVPTFAIKDADEKLAARAALFADDGACTQLLAKIDGFMGDGFAVGGVFTLADVWTYFMVMFFRSGFLDGVPADFVDKHPKMKAVAARVAANPEVKAYVESKAANPLYAKALDF